MLETHKPGIRGKLLPLVMGSMLKLQNLKGDKFRLYITGDTMIYENLKQIPQRYPDIDLALLHLGGTRAFGIMVTMDAMHRSTGNRDYCPAYSNTNPLQRLYSI
jgi:L-ascorbate metabolism protein UlaG (beta-lactamase superfamily)